MYLAAMPACWVSVLTSPDRAAMQLIDSETVVLFYFIMEKILIF
jgi:hypothetical protein